MFWKKDRAGDSTVQLQMLAESPPLVGADMRPSTLADIDQPSPGRSPKTQHSHFSSEKKQASRSQQVIVIDPCSLPQRRYFCPVNISLSRGKTFLLEGKAEGPNFSPASDSAAHLPLKTAAFKLSARFRNYSPGYYNVHWRVKATKDFNIPNGLHFVVNVKYNTEPDISGSLDVIMPPHRLNVLAKNQWYNLTLEEKVHIHPHDGVAEIQVLLCNNENTRRDEYLGFVIEHVEIRPFTQRAEFKAGVKNFLVQRAGIPNYSIDTMKSLPTPIDNSYLPSNAPVSRLVYSKGSRYLATLSLFDDMAWIRVWDMSIIRNPMNPPRNMSKLYKTSATGIVPFPGIGKLPIGIAISPLGDQITLFQEPKIGEWQEGSSLEKASFPFKLYNNPLVRHETLLINIDTPASSNVSEMKDDSPGNTVQFFDQSSAFTVNTPGTPSDGVLLKEVLYTHNILDSFIGFGEFVSESDAKKFEEERKTASDMDDGATGGEDTDSALKNKRMIKSCMFIACSGLYLDVYIISPEKKWSRSHTITLTDLLPTLSRRITCKMMMESIGSNTFMWLEDNGRSCTIWDLMTGANISHISSIENARFKGPTFRGHSKMAISPHESIVALASVDGSITTYFSRTGMAIDDRKFPGYKIEYVGFHGQDDQLCVILRNSVTFELNVKILDTLQLKSEFDINQIPIPSIGTATLCFYSVKGFWNRGVVCEADGAKIHCYTSFQPQSGKVAKSSESVLVVEPTDVVYESLIDDQAQYRVVTAFHKELLPEGDGASYWVHRVELIEENLEARTQKLVFSFIPEPWMRAMTSDVVHPENLLSAYFMPCGTRFVVVGMQTLQVWNLPTHEHSKCTLQFFWSQPREGADLKPGGVAHKSRRVRDYYLDTLNTTILVDTEMDNTVAEIKMNDKQKKKVVPMPGPGTIGARLAIVHCFRSIHLLAAAYTFATRESRRVARLGLQQNFTFEDHAAALVHFAHEHINRMMSIGVYSPRKKPASASAPALKEKKNRKARLGDEESRTLPAYSQPGSTIFDNVIVHSNANKRDEYDNVPQSFYDKNTQKDDDEGPMANRNGVVTLLTLLMDHAYLLDQNHEFVRGLLNTSNGDWIPREDIELNPIRRAIEARNGLLVEAFIDYCIKNAKKYHPAYLMPAIQCLTELSDRYPTILADMFRRASYVPAHNSSYIASHAVIANHEYRKSLKSTFAFWNYFKQTDPYAKSNNINDYAKPVLHLRSQLPFRSSNFFHVLNIETSMREKRQEKFPSRPDPIEEEERRKLRLGAFSHKIYVSPFPKLSMYGPYQNWQGIFGDPATSGFSEIAGQDYFDSPAMVAMLEFKWHKFGFYRWLQRFTIVFIFFILFFILTAKQIAIFSGDSGTAMPPEGRTDRYMVEWRPVYWVTIGFGCALLILEMLQFRAGPRKYLRSSYNYFDLAAYILPIIGCAMFLNTKVGTIDEGETLDKGPHQIWVMSFAVLALYLNLLFELRVIRQLGVVVNIILNIVRRTIWFLLIFGVFLVSFTHALLHLLHTSQGNVVCDEGDTTGETCKYGEVDGFPATPFGALSATYFFLAGRYDPVNDTLDGPSISFHIMMAIFFFFTAILLLNVLIALMNDAYAESKDEGQLAWLKQWSEVIAEIEIVSMTSGDRQNCNYFPDYIYYGANEQEAELYESKYYIASKSNLSLENRFVIDTVSMETMAMQLSQRAVLRDVQTIAREMDKLRQTQDEFNQDMARLVELMAAYLAQTATTGESGSDMSSPIDETTSTNDQNTPVTTPYDIVKPPPPSPRSTLESSRPSSQSKKKKTSATPSRASIFDKISTSEGRMSQPKVEFEETPEALDTLGDAPGGGDIEDAILDDEQEEGEYDEDFEETAEMMDEDVKVPMKGDYTEEPHPLPIMAPVSAQAPAAAAAAAGASSRPPMISPAAPPPPRPDQSQSSVSAPVPALVPSSAPGGISRPAMSSPPAPPPPLPAPMMSSTSSLPSILPSHTSSSIPETPPVSTPFPPRPPTLSTKKPPVSQQQAPARPVQAPMSQPVPKPTPLLQTSAPPNLFGKVPTVAQGRFRPSTTPTIIQHILESKVAHVDSPASYLPSLHQVTPSTPPTMGGSMMPHLPGSVYYPESGPSTSYPRYKIVDLPDSMQDAKNKANHTSLKQRLQRKLMAVHTLDDALQGGHNLLENTASNPTYVIPMRRTQSDDEDDDDDDDDDGDYEDEDEGRSRSSKGKQKSLPAHIHRTKQATKQRKVMSMDDDEYDDGAVDDGAEDGEADDVSSQGASSRLLHHEAPQRTQSELLLSSLEHEPVPLHVHPKNPRRQT